MPKIIDKAELTSESEVELYEELKRYATEAQENGYGPLEIHNAMRNVAVDMTNQFKRGAVKVEGKVDDEGNIETDAPDE